MDAHYIDVWDSATFDKDLLDVLQNRSDLIRGYVTIENGILVSHDLSDTKNTIRPSNPSASAFIAFTESMIGLMEKRTIRAWHYTRLFDSEVERMLSAGIRLSTLETLKAKLDDLVFEKVLSKSEADELFAGSPMHSNQLKARSGKFWMASHPLPIDNSGIVPLISRWGGEVVAFWQKDPALLSRLSSMGLPRVLEVAVPLSLTTRSLSFRAGEAVVGAFARKLGVFPEWVDFDLYTTAPLPGDSILRVHSQGEDAFAEIGRGYPERYIDDRHRRRKELGLDE